MITPAYAPSRWSLAFRSPVRRLAILVPLLLPLLVFAWLTANPRVNAGAAVPVWHVYIVLPITVLATLLAAVVLRTALRLRHTPTFFLGVAYLSIAGIFLVHGLSTPGIFRGENHLIEVSAWLAMLLGGVFLSLSIWGEGMPHLHRVSDRMPLALSVVVAALVAYAVVGLALTPPARPSLVAGDAAGYQGTVADDDTYGGYGGYAATAAAGPSGAATPAPSGDEVRLPALSAGEFVLLLGGVLLYGAALFGYWRRYLQTELPLVGAIAVSAALLLDAHICMLLGTPWRLNWWLYHVLILTGFSVGAGAVLWETYRGRKLHRVIEGMYVLRNEVQLELEYTDTIAIMAAATEVKDRTTQGHTLRVAQLSCRLGRELGLSPTRIRVLARAGLLHDVGKLQIPDAILKKAGALTPEEFEVMKQHPLLGHGMLRSIGHLEAEISILVAHHERLDGTGYPFGRLGHEVPFEARILSVADFFDALTADRPYRKALPWDVALEIVERAAGSHLDPECVQALVHLIATDPRSIVEALSLQPAAPRPVVIATLVIPELNPRAMHY